jgi:hypothetical protein
MKYPISILLFLLCVFHAKTQDINPFESIGKPGKILTLSKGKYTEVHINDSLQRIGSVVVNMNTGTIYDLLETDTLYSESNLDPTIISRWYSPDPIVKHHESPYASMANNPIWCIDPNGADSALATGGTTWQWQTKEGETYTSISKRTGVSIDDLRTFNQGTIKDDKEIPIGSMLNLSDPRAKAPKYTPNMQIPEGTISVFSYGFHLGLNEIGMIFTPKEENKSNEYIWFQTFNTNDPKQPDPSDPNCKALALPADRTLSPFLHWDTDNLGPMNFFQGMDPFRMPNGRIINTSKTPIGMLDGPHRPPIDNGQITWHGTLTLCKKVDSEFVIIQTFRYGWTQSGSTPTMEPLIRSTDEVSPNSVHQQYLNLFNLFGEW